MDEKLNLYFNKDANLKLLDDLKIGIISFGNQGRAQALNLKDRKLSLKSGIRADSNSIKDLKNLNLKYDDIDNVVKWADVISILLPDKVMSDVFENKIKNNLQDNQTILFSHGYNIHYNLIKPPKNINVIMVAPSGGGNTVRDEFLKGKGVPSLLAVHQDYSGNSLEIAKSYSRAIGSTRVCSFLSTFKEETETDLFGEQVLLTGGIPYMISKSLKVLLESGYSPAVAWFVSFYEVRQISELISSAGLEDFYKAVSDTAEYGGLTRSDSLVSEEFKSEMKSALQSIQSGDFHREWKEETKNGYKHLKKLRENQKQSPINDLTKKMLEALKNRTSEE